MADSRPVDALREELASMPKVELHLHLEGSLRPPQMRQLARRYRTELAEGGDPALEALYAFETFPQFLDAYKTCCRHLKTPQDYADLANQVIRELEEQHCVYAEIFLTPSICEKFGLPANEVIEAILGAAARPGHGCRVAWIFDNVRQGGPDPCWRTLEWAKRYRNRGVVGISIGGDEASEPSRAFREIFEEADKLGIHRTVHAGETCGARSVWEAVEELRAERIGHGLSALQDSMLVDSLVRSNIPLDISLTSNFKTGVVDADRPHPLAEIALRGIPFTLNTDDPGLFQTSLLEEWQKAANLLQWEPERFTALMQTTVGFTFLSEAQRDGLRSRLRSR